MPVANQAPPPPIVPGLVVNYEGAISASDLAGYLGTAGYSAGEDRQLTYSYYPIQVLQKWIGYTDLTLLHFDPSEQAVAMHFVGHAATGRIGAFPHDVHDSDLPHRLDREVYAHLEGCETARCGTRDHSFASRVHDLGANWTLGFEGAISCADGPNQKDWAVFFYGFVNERFTLQECVTKTIAEFRKKPGKYMAKNDPNYPDNWRGYSKYRTYGDGSRKLRIR